MGSPNSPPVRKETKEKKPRRLSVGRLLGLAGCFALIFALIAQANEGNGWLLVLALPTLVGGVYGTVKHGVGGFCEGSIFGTFLTLLLLLFLVVLLLWLWLISFVVSGAFSNP